MGKVAKGLITHLRLATRLRMMELYLYFPYTLMVWTGLTVLNFVVTMTLDVC